VDGEFFSRAHVRVRVDDFYLLPFDVDHALSLKVF
jgi:hypothetical protein